MKKFIVPIILCLSFQSFAITRPNVDEYIKEREEFSCSNPKSVDLFSELIRSEFETASKLAGSEMTLKSLEELVDDQETLSKIQAGLVLAPSAGIFTMAFLSHTTALSVAEILTTSISFGINSGAIPGTLVSGLIGTGIINYGTSSVLESFSDLVEEENELKKFMLKTNNVIELDTKIQEIEADTPELIVDEADRFEKILNERVGFVSYKRYKKIADNTILRNELLRLKLRDVRQMKEIIKSSCEE